MARVRPRTPRTPYSPASVVMVGAVRRRPVPERAAVRTRGYVRSGQAGGGGDADDHDEYGKGDEPECGRARDLERVPSAVPGDPRTQVPGLGRAATGSAGRLGGARPRWVSA
ncbi:hypothetical protein GCM10010307_81530 [Streptomyces vastus]|uniref:Uncharacterized protein n=1 Tax=Streptomyces vastus TaxID=285451 RepID=A0ABN3S0G7_9ACTN